MQLTVIIPTYNEAENLPRLAQVLLALPLNLHMLVVDDNSPDGTGQVADDLALQYPAHISVSHRSGKQGLGTAYLSGFRQALRGGADAVAQMDADFSHPAEKLVEMLSLLPTCDVVIGSRYVAGGAVDRCWPRWRKGLSAFGNSYARTILGIPIRDITGGFRIWRRDVLMDLPMDRVRSNGYAFQVEMAYLAHCLGYRFREIPIYFADRHWGQSKMSLRIQVEAAIRVWQILFEYRHLQPGVGAGG